MVDAGRLLDAVLSETMGEWHDPTSFRAASDDLRRRRVAIIAAALQHAKDEPVHGMTSGRFDAMKQNAPAASGTVAVIPEDILVADERLTTVGLACVVHRLWSCGEKTEAVARIEDDRHETERLCAERAETWRRGEAIKLIRGESAFDGAALNAVITSPAKEDSHE